MKATFIDLNYLYNKFGIMEAQKKIYRIAKSSDKKFRDFDQIRLHQMYIFILDIYNGILTCIGNQ